MHIKNTFAVSGPQFTTIVILVTALNGLTSSAASAESYYDWLSEQSQVILDRSYQSQAQIDADHYGPPDGSIIYDPNENAARFTMASNDGSAGALVPQFPAVSSGNLLFYWEVKYDSGFLEQKDDSGAINGTLRTHKAFKLVREASPSDQRRIEIRTRFTQADRPYVARVDVRRYIWDAAGESQPLPNQINDFAIQAETWTQFWAFVDFDDQIFSLWLADEDVPPVQLFDRFQFTSMDDLKSGLDMFQFSFNSSQDRSGPVLYIWGRNLVVLQNVPDVRALLPEAATRPRPPQDVSVAAQ